MTAPRDSRRFLMLDRDGTINGNGIICRTPISWSFIPASARPWPVCAAWAMDWWW